MRDWKILFIVNPAAGAGRAKERYDEFAKELAREGIGGAHVVTTGPGHARQLAQAAAPDYHALIAVGGDGTCFEVASGILASDAARTALGIVPLGTGNDLSVILGLHTEEDARQALAQGQTQSMDVIRIEHLREGNPALSHALLFAGVGIVSECLQQTTGTVKRLFGKRTAYWVGLLRALWSYRSPQMRIRCDRQEWENRFLFVGASNAELAGGGMKLAPGARLSDGRLNLNLVEAVGCFEVLKQLRLLRQGTHITHPRVRYLTGTHVELEATAPLVIAADGELIGHTPARLDVLPKGLRVIAPLPIP